MVICGTGHRPNKLGGYSIEAFERLVSIARNWISENSPSKVISGGALGWDQALAVASIREGVFLSIYQPFPSQACKWPESSQRLYKRILNKANSVIAVCDDPYAAWKMQKRNEAMVDDSDIVLAMYDGSVGGTGNCIDYATKQSKKIINLFEFYERN